MIPKNPSWYFEGSIKFAEESIRLQSRKTGRMMPQKTIEINKSSNTLLHEVSERSATNVSLCLHCRTCACGCPFLKGMDYPPNAVLRLLQYGLCQQALECKTIWVCVACHTCSSQCPVGIDIAAVMNTLRLMAIEKGISPGKPNILTFHQEVIRSLKHYGRTHKLGIMWRYKMYQQGWFQDLDVGLKMLVKHKLELWPSRVKAMEELSFLFPKDKELA
jgi:heterodisulfide reductase subunit C